MTDLQLRANIMEVMDKYCYNIGGLSVELLFYHVNNEDEFKDTGFTKEQLLDQLEYMEERGVIERVDAYILKEPKIKLKGDVKKWK